MSTPAAPRRAAVIVNPVKADVAKLRAAVAAAESAAGWAKSVWLETTVAEPGGGLAARAVQDGADVVLAAGGDGTVRVVAEALRNTGVPLALVPSGTGNLLARNLGLDVSASRLESLVEIAFTGVDHAIDTGVVRVERPETAAPDGAADAPPDEHVFLVIAGIGLDAKMIANTDPELKKKVGWLAYVGAIGRVLVDTEVLRVRYTLDGGETRPARVHTVLVGNCGQLPGNIALLPDAEVDDGLLDIVALRPEGFFGWSRVLWTIVWENGVLRRSSAGRKLLNLRNRPVRALRYLRGRRFAVHLDRAEEFELDGDEFGLVTSFEARVDPASLLVRLPRDT